jgi:energy-coupling factor transporter ATP-binding protein EcfA2
MIDTNLSAEGPIRLKRREAARLVIGDLCGRGELVQAAGGRLFWYDRLNKRLYDLDGFQFRCLFLKHFQINPAEREFAHVFEAVKAVAREEGRRVHVVRFSFYDKGSSRLYVHGGPGSILRLDGTAISIVDNGTDDVLFEDTEETLVIPPESLTFANPGDALGDLIVGRVNFIRGSGVILSPDQQCLMFRIWILSIFFPELLPARCLLLLYGEKGSGKSTTLRVVLKLLLGPHANVTPLGKEDGFNAAVSSEYLLVLDNVDSYCKWIEDRLATVATGQTIRLRKLYTTNEMLSFPTRCAIALTARTPRFRRDDVVDRLQILRVARLEAFGKESDWYQEIETQRARLWAQILRELNAIVASLGAASAKSPDNIRMADWASLATTIGDTLDHGAEVRAALEASELDKAHFLLEADEIYDLIHALAQDRPDSDWRAGELFAELKRRAERADVEFTIKSPRSLGRILHRLEPALKLMISFRIATDDHDKQAIYTLGPLREDNGSDLNV